MHLVRGRKPHEFITVMAGESDWGWEMHIPSLSPRHFLEKEQNEVSENLGAKRASFLMAFVIS